MPLNILFIRHGQTQGNLERRYIGSTDQPLCPEGREALAGRQLPPANQIYASPLLRCRETASLLFPSQPFEVVEDFRECDFGAFENHTYEELKDGLSALAGYGWRDTAARRREQGRPKDPHSGSLSLRHLPAQRRNHCPGSPRRHYHGHSGIPGAHP